MVNRVAAWYFTALAPVEIVLAVTTGNPRTYFWAAVSAGFAVVFWWPWLEARRRRAEVYRLMGPRESISEEEYDRQIARGRAAVEAARRLHRTPQDATPQDAPAREWRQRNCAHDETITDSRLLSTQRFTSCYDCGAEL